MIRKTVCLALVFCLAAACAGVDAHAYNQNIIRVENEVFKDGESVFYYAGANCYYLMEFASQTQGPSKTRAGVDEVLTEAKAMGLTVIRTWAFSTYLQTSPGVYNSAWLDGLDYVLYKANELDLRVIMVLTNNWSAGQYSGISQYVDWSPTASTHDEFYTDVNTRQHYKAHAAKLINRFNSYNSRTYKDDPAIFSWELCNEPRTETQHTFSTELDGWIEEMSTYIKSIDPGHMVSAGLEGFYKDKPTYYSNWMGNGYTGTDFIDNHNHANIDFATIHCLPNDWGVSPTTMNMWTTLHLNDAKNILKKPMIIEELGVKKDAGGATTQRDSVFGDVFNLSYHLNGGGNMFWSFYGNTYPDYDGYGVYYPDSASTVNVISSNAGLMKNKKAPFWNLVLPVKRAYCSDAAKSGAGACQLILQYLDEANSYPYDTLYNVGHEYNEPSNSGIAELDPTAVTAVLNEYKLPPYNFSVIQTATAEDLMKYICHWMDYEVPNAEKKNVPVAIPIMTGYNHWVIINGASTDAKPNANQHLWTPGQFTVFGFTLMDPVFGTDFIGHQVYKTAAELVPNYIKPLTTADKYNGKFVVVAEPPEAGPGAQDSSSASKALYARRISRLRLRLAGRKFNSATDMIARKISERFTFANLEKIVDPNLLGNQEFTDIFYGSKPQNALYVKDLSGGNKDYYIVPMGKEKTGPARVAMVINEHDGSFRELSWSKNGNRYLPLNKNEALKTILDKRGSYRWWDNASRLVYSPEFDGCSLYYPSWEVRINGREKWIVGQNGSAKSAPVIVISPAQYARRGRAAWIHAYIRDMDGTVKEIAWNFGDGTRASGNANKNPVWHVWTRPGVYAIECKAKDNDGLSNSAVCRIIVR